MNKIDWPIKIFSDYTHYKKTERSELSSFLKPYWKDMAFTEDERLRMYGIGEKDFAVINDIKDSDIVIIPMQDVLNLGGEARMNFPGKLGGNWTWRMKWEQVASNLPHSYKQMAELYERPPKPVEEEEIEVHAKK